MAPAEICRRANHTIRHREYNSAHSMCLLAILGGGLALVLLAMTEAVILHAPQAQSGIASGMLNVSRQVGGVFGVAILGTLVGNQQTFLSGTHLAFVIAGGVLIFGLVSAWVFLSAYDRRSPQGDPFPRMIVRYAVNSYLRFVLVRSN